MTRTMPQRDRRSRRVFRLALAMLLAACGGLAPAPVSLTGATSAASPLAGIGTVFVIVMENHDWAAIKGNPAAPYLNDTLLPLAAHAEQYYNPPGVHPSLPNYLWLEAGQDFGIRDDADPATHHQATRAHLTAQLDAAGITWKSYQEDINGDTCPLSAVGNYAPRHNPMVYFDDVTGGNDPQAAPCRAHVRPYGELAGDLRAGTVPRYAFITPNLCHDMHDSCRPLTDPIRQGDDWLASAVPAILASAEYRAGGALFITWDEGEGNDGPIGLLALSPRAKAGYQNTIHYTHGALLATLQHIFRVGPVLADAATATDLSDLFAAPTAPPVTPFADVPTDYWAYAPIEQFFARGITTGCDTGLFCPERNVTRAEMAAFLTRTLGQVAPPAPPATPIFADVPADHWAYASIEQFARLGITTGCGTDAQGRLLFCPDRKVTRAEMAVFLDRAKGRARPPAPATATFADVPTDYWAYAFIEQFLALNITTGCGTDAQGNRSYCPERNVTRAEMAVFLLRAYP